MYSTCLAGWLAAAWLHTWLCVERERAEGKGGKHPVYRPARPYLVRRKDPSRCDVMCALLYSTYSLQHFPSYFVPYSTYIHARSYFHLPYIPSLSDNHPASTPYHTPHRAVSALHTLPYST